MPLHRGRLPSDLQLLGVRELTRDDLACLKQKRTTPAVQRMSDTHHRLARLLASGLRPPQAAAECGFSIARVYILNADPSFRDLVESYRKDVHDAYVSAEEERHKLATEVNLKALRHINDAFDKADEENELVPIGRALAVFADTSDRVGLQKRSTTTNINVDFAARLEKARAASLRARPVVHAVAHISQGVKQQVPPAQPADRTYIEGNLVRKI